MAMKEAVEQMGQVLRWVEQPKDAEDKSIYLGPVVQGFYKNKKTNVGQNDSNLYEILLSDGTLVGVWGSGLLDGKFQDIPVGCEVRITYLGVAQPKTPKGRAYQNFKVEYDADSRAPMAQAGAPVAPAAPVAPVAPAQATSTPAAAPAAPVAPAPAAPTAPAAPAPTGATAPANQDGF